MTATLNLDKLLNHPILTVTVGEHFLSYALVKECRILALQRQLITHKDTFQEIKDFCIRGGFFDVRVTCETFDQYTQMLVEKMCKAHGWAFQNPTD